MAGNTPTPDFPLPRDMDFEDFLGDVQDKAQLDSREAALTVTRCTLTSLSARIQPGEANDLAAQLPEEIGRFLTETDGVESFSFEEFVDRVAECGGYGENEVADAVFGAQVVMDVLGDATTDGEFEDVRSQLPEDEFDELFEITEQEESVSPSE